MKIEEPMIFKTIRSPKIVGPLTHQVSVCLDLSNKSDAEPASKLRLSNCRAQLEQRRKAQYLAGRHCMNEAIRAACCSASLGSSASVRYSELILASMTQTGSFVSAAVTLKDHTQLLGIDSELIFTNDALSRLWSVVLTKREVANFEWKYKLDFSRKEYLSLAFSAKQSLMKAFSSLRPPGNVYYQDLRITLDQESEQSFRFELLKTISDNFPKGFSEMGHYDFAYEHVHTAVEL